MNLAAAPALLLRLAVALAAGVAAAESPRSPSDEAATFRFADPRLVAECVAHEPEILSPVAIAWDAGLRLFVVEMTDYPTARTCGRIRRLQDRDHDGRYETASVFAAELPFPTSVLPWRDGVLVAAAPDILFLRDIDDDGRADSRQVLFTGFGQGNQQLRVNGLTWGPDGWVYGANGRSDGSVRRPEASGDQGIPLRGRDFRFRPATGEFETLAGRSQFGLAFDDWGNRFLSWNTIPVRHEVFPDNHLARQAQLAGFDIVADCLPAGDSGEVFPLTPLPLVFNNESSSHFNALAGLTLYRGDVLGPEYAGDAFVGETLRNLVHRRRLVPDGPTFLALRPETGTEFLRSTDPWFHPVNFATGPDGALYVVDFYREFVEHPDFVPREMRQRLAWDSGSEHGRIWRIRRNDRPAPKPPGPLAQADSGRLLRELQHPNAWRRETAQQLLAERQATNTANRLTRIARRGPSPESRAAALHTLQQLNSLPAPVLFHALRDPHPRVREQAILLLAPRLQATSSPAKPPEALPNALARLARDSDPRVRLQTALAVAGWTHDSARSSLLEEIIAANTNRWIRLAAASGLTQPGQELLASLRPPAPLRPPPPQPRGADPDREAVISRHRDSLQLRGDAQRGASTAARLCFPCHYFQGQGQRIGPDLSGLASRPPEQLLIDLLDPSRQVAPDYTTYEVSTRNGDVLTGLLASESATRVILRLPGEPDHTLPRSEVETLRATDQSLMPDGLEQGLSSQDLADLLEFLRQPVP